MVITTARQHAVYRREREATDGSVVSYQDAQPLTRQWIP